MYILMISRGYPEPKEPQWGNFERDQAEALIALGHKVVMASVDGRFRLKWRKLGTTHFEKHGVEVYSHYLLPDKFLSYLNKRVALRFFSWQLGRLYKKIAKEHGKPDVLYAHYLYNTAVSVNLKERYQVPLVGIEHWSELNRDRLGKYVRYLGERTYAYTDRNIAVAANLSKRIEQHFGQGSTVVHNMVNASFFEGDVVTKTISDRFKFITTGSLIQRKGFDLLIDAFAQLPNREMMDLVIIGDGPMKEGLHDQINSLGLSNSVSLLGKKSKEEIRKLLHEADAFVISSYVENFSVAVLEALSAGLPCVATLCGGTDECIFDFNGKLVPVGDVESLARAMHEVKDNYALYDKQRIADDCKARYAPNVIAQQLAKVFEEVIEGK